MTELEKLKKEREEIDKKIEALANKLPENGWLKHKYSPTLINKNGDNTGFGFNKRGDWEYSCNWSFYSYPNNWRVATEEEIKSALIAEAKKRGFKEGVMVNRSKEFIDNAGLSGFYGCSVKIYNDVFEYDKDHDVLYLDTYLIYHKGQWAEVIKEEIKIAGEVVDYIDGFCKCGGNLYTVNDLLRALNILSFSKVTGIQVTKCNGEKVIVTKDEIQNVLNNWK
jgi:hypothetical protein